MADILARNPDLTKIINKAVKRIGENHALARDNAGVEMKASEIEKDRAEFRKGRIQEGKEEMTTVIEESLKAAADEMAQKLVLENTIDGMIKEVMAEQDIKNIDETKLRKAVKKVIPTENTVNESTTHMIKKLLKKKLKQKLEEVKIHPGYDAYDKAVKKSKTENDKAMKASNKKFKQYQDFEGNENPEFPHQEMSKTNSDGQFQYYRNDEEDQEFVDDFAYPGLIDFDINNLNLDRLTKYLEGSSETGNAQEDKDGQALGNVVPSDLGKRMMKSANRRKEKIAAQKASMSNLRGYTPDVQKVKQVKEEVTQDMDKMEKLWSYDKNTQ